MSSIPAPSTSAQHPLVLPALIGTLFLSLLPRPSNLRRCIFVPLILYLAYHFHRNPLLPNDSAISYSVATLWTLWLRIVVFHLQSDPPENLYRPTWGEKPGDPAKYGPVKKAIWAAHLFSTPRHVGFVNSSAPPRQSPAVAPSRAEFLKKTAIRIPILYLILDASRTFLLTRSYFDSNVSLFSIPLPYRLFDALVYGVSAAGAMQLHYHVGALASVGLGIADPTSWPPLFGDLTKVDSVAGFWSRGWHSMLTEIFRGLWDICGLRQIRKRQPAPGSKATKIGQGFPGILMAFVVSGGGHALAMWTASRGLLWKGQVKFFLSQVLALGLERLVGWEGTRRVGGGKSSRVGQLWMMAVILLSAGWMADEMGRVGMYRTPPVPVSVVRPVLRALGMWDKSE